MGVQETDRTHVVFENGAGARRRRLRTKVRIDKVDAERDRQVGLWQAPDYAFRAVVRQTRVNNEAAPLREAPEPRRGIARRGIG